MAKSGIKIVTDSPGSGPELQKGDRVRICYDIMLNHGEVLASDQKMDYKVGDRNVIAGFRYGLEGMRVGGSRLLRASPHLCYRDEDLARIPKNAVLVINIKSLELVKRNVVPDQSDYGA